jgi:hypothetical protein
LDALPAWDDSFYNTNPGLIESRERRRIIFNQWFDLFSSVPCFEMGIPQKFNDWSKVLELV